jgi:plasmid stability protein
MTTVVIRDVPESVRNELAARAARSGKSMQQYVLQALQGLVARPAQEDVLNEIRKRASMLPELERQSLLADLHSEQR